MKKTTALKNLISSNNLEFIMEAHNGLSAKIVEEAGFKGIWASSLSISAALGVRDNNEASWTQILEVLEFMSDNTSIPILLDGDTGYGNFNNVRRLIRKLEQRGIAGVCLEDKLFPKTNSLLDGSAQPLADITEFVGKIKAAKDVQQDSDFQVVTRIEAFIAGWGLDEVLKRADAYKRAGSDAVLIHSKKATSEEIELFMNSWGKEHPVVIVPTKYYSTPTEKFADLGVNLIIWANHNLRASIKSMQNICKQIKKDNSLINVEPKVASVAEVFRIQGADELKQAEKLYLPATEKHINTIVLAASQGDVGELTKDIPKTMLNVNGKTILKNQIDDYKAEGITDIVVIRGFAKDKIKESNIIAIDNDDFDSTGELYSLSLAKDQLKNTVISYGDIVCKRYILHELLNDENDITLVVDSEINGNAKINDFVKTDSPFSKSLYFSAVQFEIMATDLPVDSRNGEFIGLWKVNEKGAEIVKAALKDLAENENFNSLSLPDLFNYIIKDHKISVIFIKGGWLDIDTIADLQRIETIK
jgi:phosphoenolpyruvate phosphomutase